MDAVEPGKHLFDEELAFAVGVGGLECGVLGDGDEGGFAVDGGGGAEDELLDAGVVHGFEQGEGGRGVVAEVELGLLHGFAGFDEGGEVEDAFGVAFPEDLIYFFAISEVCLDEGCAFWHVFALGVDETIDDGDFVAFF